MIEIRPIEVFSEVQEAIPFFEKAVQLDPHFAEAYYNLAQLYRQDLKTIQSVACFRKIIEMEGERSDLGKLARKELDWFERTILETTGQSLEKYLQGMTLFDRAYACLRAEDHEEAIELFQQVLQIDPDHVQSYGNMALAHSALGNQKIALQYLDKALLLDPTYEPAQQNRKNISRLKEGEKCNFETKEVFYYQEQLASLGKKRKKPRVLSWFSIFLRQDFCKKTVV